MKINPADQHTINKFMALYGGGLAEKQRATGNAGAMPPWTETYWLGKQVVKNPCDLWVYQEIIVETRPDLIIETGTSGGGSAFFFATICDLINHGEIITVDKDHYPELWREHARIKYLIGDSVSEAIADQMRAAAANKRVMVVLDSLHTYEHVARELALYAPFVASGCYLVVEDTGCINDAPVGGDWCNRAAYEWVLNHPEFVVDHTRERHLLTSNYQGWLRRN